MPKLFAPFATFALIALTAFPASSAQPLIGDNWRLLSPSPTGESLSRIVVAGTNTVAVGNGTTVLSSPTLLHGSGWVPSRANPSAAIGVPSRAAYSSAAGKILMAFGSQFMQSTDSGESWSAVNADLPEFGAIAALSAAQGEFMVVQNGYDETGNVSRLATSTNGINWTVRGEVPNNGAANQVTRDTAGRYVLVGNTFDSATSASTASVWSTTDGVTWSTTNLDASSNLKDVLWTGTRFVTVGGSLCYRSSDGITWAVGGALTGAECMAKGGANLVALGDASVFTSADEGQTWTARAAPAAPFNPVDVVHDGTAWIAVGANGVIHTSSNGISWLRRTPSGPIADFTSIAYNGSNLYIAMGSDERAWYSSNGTTWNRATNFTFPDAASVLWDGTQFVITGNFFSTITTDANSWSSKGRFGPSNQEPHIIEHSAFAAGKYVAIGYDFATDEPVIYSGTAFDTFVQRTVPANTGGLRALTRGGSLWTIVGDFGTILTSADGNTWTKRSAGTAAEDYQFEAVASSGSIIVAGGSQGYDGYFTSINGITWVKQTSLNNGFSSIAWTGAQFVAMNPSSNSVHTSKDGINWTSRGMPTSAPITNLALSSAQLLGVGANNTVVSSDIVSEINFSAASQDVFESDATASISITLTSPATSAVTVPLTVHASSTAVLNTDYSAIPASITFNPGEQVKLFTVPLLDDSAQDGTKTVRILAGSGSGARLGSMPAHLLSILDNDTPPTVAFTRTEQTAMEHAGSIALDIELSTPAPGAVTVNLTTSGDASSSTDYTAPASVSFTTGQRRKSVIVTILDDSTTEEPKTATFTLASPSGATLASSDTEFTLTLIDNDPATSRWTLRNPAPTAAGLSAIASTASGYIVVGGGGTVLLSNDGISWTQRFTGVAGNLSLNDVVVAGSQILVSGDGGHVLSSTDGIAWTDSLVAGPEAEIYLLGITSSGTRHVAVGYSYEDISGYKPCIYSSADGMYWTAEALPISQGNLYGVAWNGNAFVAVGNLRTSSTNFSTVILTSPDGRAWTDKSAALPVVALSEVNAIGTDFYATDFSKNVHVSTDNGVTWTKRAAGTIGNVVSFAKGGSKTIGVGMATTTSTGPTSFTQVASPTKIVLHDITYSSSQFVAIGGVSTIYTSPDGVAWTKRSAGIDNYASYLAAAWVGTQFIAVGDNPQGIVPTPIATSPDGITWTERTNALKKGLRGVAWNGLTAIAVGSGGTVVGSANGIAWAARASGTTLDLHSVIWARNLFVAVGGHRTGDYGTTGTGGAIVLTSPDGTTWTRRTVPTNHPLKSVTFTGSSYIAVGDAYSDSDDTGDAVMLTSPDAITWTPVTSGINGTDFTSVASDGAGHHVAVTSDSSIIISTNLTTWTDATIPALPTDTALNEVIWAGSQFVASTSQGHVLYSSDGTDWSYSPTEIGGSIEGLAWNGQTLVAVGSNASIQTSGVGGSLPVPSVNFALAASSFSESSATAAILVRLSSPPVAKATVTLGTANPTSGMILIGATADVVVPTLPLVFNPGETEKYFTVTIKNDKATEITESLDVRLVSVTGGATLGTTQATHTLTITDNDALPTVTISPSALFTTGSPITLTATPAGAGPFTYQWKKNNVALAATVVGSKSANLYIHAAAIIDGADYTCTVTDANALSATSTPSRIVVYENIGVPVNVLPLTTGIAKVTQLASANCVLHWFKGTTEITTALPTGVTLSANRATLTVTNLTANGDNYRCDIELPGVNSAALAGGNRYNIFSTTQGPGVNALASLPTGQIGSYYYHQVSTTGSADGWTAVGLPLGLSINNYGVISGFPEVANTVARVITITAKNGFGTSIIKPTLIVNALPTGLAGTQTGLLPRDPANNNLGALVTLTIASNGYCTAAYTVGTTKASVIGRLIQLPGPVTVWRLTTPTNFGNPKAVINGNIVEVGFTFDDALTDPKGSGIITITAPGGTPAPVSYTARQPLTGTTLATYVGRHTFALQLANAPDTTDITKPHGHGFGSASIATSGVITFTAKMGDGLASSVFTATAPLSTDGTSPLYASLYLGKGSLMALPKFTVGGSAPAYADSTIVDITTASWVKLPDTSIASVRTYPAGWSALALRMEGSKYIAPTPPTTSIVMGLTYTAFEPNAELTFGLDPEPVLPGFDADPDVEVNLKPGGTIETIFVNPRSVTLATVPATGAFSGTVNMSTTLLNNVAVPRAGLKYEGQIVRIIGNDPEQQGYGFFSLPQVPDINISPAPLATSTPIVTTPVLLSPMTLVP